MHRIVLWIQGVLVPLLGAPGLFVVAFLDSSFLSLPEINDLLVVSAAAADPHMAWIPILMATLGSVTGSALLWEIGRKGGEPFLVRRFGKQRVDQTRRVFHRWDVLAIAIPAVLPPPIPFKIFVLSSGVFGFPFRRLMATLLVARGLRYVFWGVMGGLYGQRAAEVLRRFDAWFREESVFLGIVLAVLIVAVLVVWASRSFRDRPGQEV
jgi:membrane protein YqaA with SNARE-associated domain